jgi:hypothetical protein
MTGTDAFVEILWDRRVRAAVRDVDTAIRLR